MYKKIHVLFFHFSLHATLLFTFMNALVYVDISQGIHKVKSKVAHNKRNEKNYMGFTHNIWQILKRFSRVLSLAQFSFF